ncbi:FtsQ-type POTRA domain-containing protein [Curtobacterium herbarum]|uniref:POTRA domain-containing protein n=1 Tax=Curtobacterium herbarum TaxID=150122 RepID=A0ABN1ZDI5_9MICO|nr:FtsQ-type POTRA domain-containing protein [Curtobacterium herbarum]MBM7475780.1 cell division septal protein FtsQ [Curtobacterium herbarum]MCS6543690.1 FtsQ-type POTRA domain-containing protein [Curtobacterium herbarum]
MKRPEGFDDRAGADERSTDPDTPDGTARSGRPARGGGFRSALSGAREARRAARTSAPRDDVAASTPASDVDPLDALLPDLPEVDLTEDDRTADARLTAPVPLDRHRTGTVATGGDVTEPGRASRPAATRTTGTDAHTDAHDATDASVSAHVPHETPIGARARAAETAREARIARKRRRLLERAEVRRFTRRSRYRRAAWTTAGGVVVVLVASILVAVFSPLMALQRIEVQGTDRVDAAEVRSALSGQIGTPLARIDLDEVKRRIAGFPLIESYVTEEEPPHTLVVTVTERTPVVAVQSGKSFDLVDPAGIVVQSTTKRPSGMPVADIGRAKLGSTVFRTMTEVVLAMPASVREQVSGISASTSDDVTLTMGDGSSVVWGSPDESPAKATLLAALVKDHAARDKDSKVEYDVSAPDNGIIRPQG